MCRQTRLPDRCIVIDNGSGGMSRSPLRVALERVAHSAGGAYRSILERIEWIMPAENLGFARACNLALATAADCQWLVTVNNDAVLAENWIELVLAGAVSPQVALIGGELRQGNVGGRIDGRGDAYHGCGAAWRQDHGRATGMDTLRGGSASSPDRPFSICAAAALYRREALLHVGGFDARYFCYFEDVDLAFRLQMAGYEAHYVPDAVAWHVGGASTRRNKYLPLYYGHRNLVWTYWKDMPWPLLIWFLPQHLLWNIASLGWALAQDAESRRAMFRAKWDAVRGLPRTLRERATVQRVRRRSCLDLYRRMRVGPTLPYRRFWHRMRGKPWIG